MTAPALPYRKSHPIDFTLADANQQPVLRIVGPESSCDLTLTIRNRSRHIIDLSGRAGAAPSAGNHHFALRFRAGTLSVATLRQLSDPGYASSIATPGWTLAKLESAEDGDGVTLYFLCTDNPTLAPDEQRSVTLRGFSAAPGSGARGTQVELVPHQLNYRGDPAPITLARTQYLHITNYGSAERVLPLQLSISSGRTLFSDGKTPTTIVLRFTNTTASDLTLQGRHSDQPTRFSISFDVGPDWALVKSIGPARTDLILVNGQDGVADNGVFRTSGTRAECVVTFSRDCVLPAQMGIDIRLAGIVPAGCGEANLYVNYANLPDHGAGHFVCTFERSLLVPASDGVGIGTRNPKARLDIVGAAGEARAVRIDSGEVKLCGGANGDFSIVNRGDGVLGIECGRNGSALSLDAWGTLRVVGNAANIEAHMISLLSRGRSGDFWITNNDGCVRFETRDINPGSRKAVLSIHESGEVTVGGGAAKTFIINHPQGDERYLVHATLEGPEAAVFYRGTARLVAGEARVALPRYFEALTRPEGRTITLTNVDGLDPLAIKTQDGAQIKDGTFIVIGHAYSSQAFNWEAKAVRRDVQALDVEPLKEELQVRGFGPYAYGIPAPEGDET